MGDKNAAKVQKLFQKCKFFEKKCKKICTCQKKAVLLHPLFKKWEFYGFNGAPGNFQVLGRAEAQVARQFSVAVLTFAILSRFARGAIAQLVEQRTENPCVPSSILGGTTESLSFEGLFCKLSHGKNHKKRPVEVVFCFVLPANRNIDCPPGRDEITQQQLRLLPLLQPQQPLWQLLEQQQRVQQQPQHVSEQ